MATTTLQRVTPDDPALISELVELRNAVVASDAPFEAPWTERFAHAALTHGWDGEPPQVYLARDLAGVAVATVQLGTSERDNLDTAWIEIEVHPEHRRLGHGSRVLELGAELARQQGRDKHFFEAWDNDASRGFGAAHALVAGLISVRRGQPIAGLDLSALRHLHEEAALAASDYEVHRVLGPLPDEVLEPVVAVAAAMNDAPMDDIDMEDEDFSGERMRAYEAAQEACGRTLYRAIAVHRDTGEIGGHTVVALNREQPEHAEQHDTAVSASHRGHRLGLLLKAEVVLWLREAEPQLRQVTTWNAASNQHMIAVNEALGYQVLAAGAIWKRPDAR